MTEQLTEQMMVRSINVGKPVQVEHHGKEIETGIYKTPVSGPLFLSAVNLRGTVRPISFIMAVRIKPFAFILSKDTRIGSGS
ncbi:hypothetical protein HMSSN036_12470 [Paenibacillus macerans]|nr:hypothetical protein HMSSN036_12470 [Paenibacillus macerans]